MKKAILTSEIDLRFRPSIFLWGWLGLFSILVCFSLWYCLPVRWAVPASMGYAALLFWQCRTLPAMRAMSSVQTLHVDVYGQMTVSTRDGRQWLCEVLPASVVQPAYLILHLQSQLNHEADMGQALPGCPASHLLVMFDQAEASQLKALRVWLRWGALQPA